MSNQLDPIAPVTAIELYHEQRRDEVAESTLELQEYHLKYFHRWLDEETDVETLDELTGKQLHEYRLWRRDYDGGIAKTTLKTNVEHVNLFLSFCERIDAVPDGASDVLDVPDIADPSRDEYPSVERMSAILNHAAAVFYASRDHAVLELTWHAGLRVGALRALDLGDFYPDDQRLQLVHRPETGTPLKNGGGSERHVALDDRVTEILVDYVRHKRRDSTDEHGREPLFTTEYGRPADETLRDAAYRFSQPCRYTGECPHEEDIGSCQFRENGHLSKCPSSLSMHPIRRGAITHHLRRDVPKPVVSDRTDVSSEVLDAHYNEMTAEEKAEQRRGYLDNI